MVRLLGEPLIKSAFGAFVNPEDVAATATSEAGTLALNCLSNA
jgi:hypothetical protein